MKKICFYDLNNDGHHWFYNYTLLKAFKGIEDCDVYYYTSIDMNSEEAGKLHENNIIIANQKDSKRTKNKIKKQLFSLLNIIKLIGYINKEGFDEVHLLTYDEIIISSVLLLLAKKGSRRITATLHWLPGRKIKWRLFKFNLKLGIIDKVVVHGEYIKNKLIETIGVYYKYRIVSIDYPRNETKLFNREYCINKLGIDRKTPPFLLYFGGLRYDKGVDILIKALKSIKKDYTLIIAGSEDEYTEQYLLSKISEYCIGDKVELNIKYIKEEDVPFYFSIADIVVLPYRKKFAGQSGPLTEGVAHNCIIVGPGHGQVGYTITNYKIGYTFETEDIHSLQAVLEYVIDHYKEIEKTIVPYQEEYNRITSIDGFIKSYRAFINIDNEI